MDSFIEAWEKRDISVYWCRPLWDWVQRNGYTAPTTAVVVYVSMIFIVIPQLRWSSRDRVPSYMKHLFAAWNLLLSAFSLVGMAATVPYVARTWQQHGLRHLVCSDAMIWGTRQQDASCYGFIGLMMSFFMLSKFPELCDTFFLSAMNKEISFLHWYHHVTVLLYSWFAYKTSTPSAVLFGTMNYCVHTIMYFYFGVSGYTRAFSFMRKPITSIQLLQMAVGCATTTLAFFYERHNSDGTAAVGGCSATYTETLYYPLCLAMYGSYFVLFAMLFVKNYASSSGSKSRYNGSGATGETAAKGVKPQFKKAEPQTSQSPTNEGSSSSSKRLRGRKED